MNQHPEHLEAQFEDALRRLVRKHSALVLELDWDMVIMLIGNLQLALRCPSHTGPSAAGARYLVDVLIARIEKIEPALGPLLRLGDNPDCDDVCDQPT